MSSPPQPPPHLQEQLMRVQQEQQNMEYIMSQKQQLEIEKVETDRALGELKKAGDGDAVYKHAGSVLIKSTKAAMVSELEEKMELAKTRSTVLQKQEARVAASLSEHKSKLTKMMKDVQRPGGS